MSYSRGQSEAPSFAIHTFGRFSGHLLPAGLGSTAWGTANLALYAPVLVPRRIVVVKLALSNGGTADGNIDLGIYDESGTLLVSTGAVAQSGTDTEQVRDIADTTLGPGVYYLGVSLSSAAGRTRAYPTTAPIPAALGLLMEAAAHPLPATATWVVANALVFYPSVAMLTTTVIA